MLQKFARVVLQTNNIDHHRTADFPALAAALRGKPEATASMRDVYNAPAILLIGNNPTEEHPLLAWQIRNNVRLHGARLYVVNSEPIKLERQAVSFCRFPLAQKASSRRFWPGMIRLSALSQIVWTRATRPRRASTALRAGSPGRPSPHEPSPHECTALREKLRGEQNLVIIFGSELAARRLPLW